MANVMAAPTNIAAVEKFEICSKDAKVGER